MKKPAAVFLCDYSGVMAKPWAKAGIECWCVDTEHSIRNPVKKKNIKYIWGDCRSWCPPEGRKWIFFAAFPPCTNDAVSGARDFKIKGGIKLRDSLELFESCRMAGAWSGAPYIIEHPITILSNIPHIGKPDYQFDPCDYAGYLPKKLQNKESYTKKTLLWTGNGFIMPKKKPVTPELSSIIMPKRKFNRAKLGSYMHKLGPSEERENLRSKTPLGFSIAVFKSNYREQNDSH